MRINENFLISTPPTTITIIINISLHSLIEDFSDRKDYYYEIQMHKNGFIKRGR